MLKVLHPFLVILVMMGLLQFSGQGAITFYTAQIFKVKNLQSLIVFSDVDLPLLVFLFPTSTPIH